MNLRVANINDIEQLIQMRWDFTFEESESITSQGIDFGTFSLECGTFLENAINSERWFIWVAEEESKIISHIYIELIQKVPRPGRVTYPFAFMTNVYTLKDFRNKGIGSKLLTTINEWAQNSKYEFIIVWPSNNSIGYYKKNGYIESKEAMEFYPS